MQVLETHDLIAALESRLQEAVEVDVAVAWARSGAALDLLQAAAKRGVTIRAVVGLAGNHTQPFALRTLAEIGELRIADGREGRKAPGGIFHPKVLIFRTSKGSVGWIGSANLTVGGYMKNLEAVAEVTPADALSPWFERLWDRLPKDPSDALERYEADWAPSPYGLGDEAPTKARTKKADGVPKRPALGSGSLASWDAYEKALSQADEYWRWWSRDDGQVPQFSVMHESYSWLGTIEAVGSLIRRPRWGVMPDVERWVLLGMGKKGGEWGLLGSMAGAGDAKSIFRGNTAKDRTVLGRVHASPDVSPRPRGGGR